MVYEGRWKPRSFPLPQNRICITSARYPPSFPFSSLYNTCIAHRAQERLGQLVGGSADSSCRNQLEGNLDKLIIATVGHAAQRKKILPTVAKGSNNIPTVSTIST